MKAITKLVAIAAGCLLLSLGQPARATTKIYPSSTHGSALVLPDHFMDMKVSEFIRLSAKDYQTITSKKMNLKERISFSLLKKSMKKSLKANQDQTVKDYLATADKGDKTALIIILVVVVVVIAAVVISSVNSIGPFYTGG